MQKEDEFVHFCSHTSKATGFLSNWFESKFDLDGIHFVSVEQAMMYKKAILMGDERVAQHVLTTSDPKKIKQYGRSVKNWNQELWESNKIRIVTEALTAKFSQNLELQEKLLATRNAWLVEAAHYDTVWGNGLSANHPDATKPENWPGLNLLGQCLMRVREAIRATKQ